MRGQRRGASAPDRHRVHQCAGGGNVDALEAHVGEELAEDRVVLLVPFESLRALLQQRGVLPPQALGACVALARPPLLVLEPRLEDQNLRAGIDAGCRDPAHDRTVCIICRAFRSTARLGHRVRRIAARRCLLPLPRALKAQRLRGATLTHHRFVGRRDFDVAERRRAVRQWRRRFGTQASRRGRLHASDHLCGRRHELRADSAPHNLVCGMRLLGMGLLLPRRRVCQVFERHQS